MLVYLFGYVITQFSIFFVRDNLVVSFLGLNWGLKQAQWTSLVLFVLLIPLTLLVLRFSKPVPVGEVAATYGIPQKVKAEPVVEAKAAKLVFHEDGRFQGLDTSAVSEIVERVKAWYDALPKQIMPA